MMESCSRSKLKLENHNDRPRLASHWGYNCSIGFDLFFLTFKWHIYHWSILYSPTVWWKKFAAVLWYSPHADDGIEQLGPRLFSIWGNIFPFSVMGGSLGRWRCCVLREVPFASSSDTFFVCGQSRLGIRSYHLRSSTEAAHGEFSLPSRPTTHFQYNGLFLGTWNQIMPTEDLVRISEPQRKLEWTTLKRLLTIILADLSQTEGGYTHCFSHKAP